jgi:hypothetical protein
MEEDMDAQQWYHLIKKEESDPYEKLHTLGAIRYDFFGVDEYELRRGGEVKEWHPDSWLASDCPANDGEPFDFLHNCLGLPVVSPRLRSVLESEVLQEGEVQFLPVSLFRSTGEKIDGFSIMNVLRPVEALDRQHCRVLTEDPEKIDPATGKPWVAGVGVYAVFAAAVAGRSVVRLKEFPPPILVSERFVAAFKRNKFLGGYFPKVIVTP